MPTPHTQWTVEKLDDLPDDGNRYEIIDGELFVTPAPSYPHQRGALRLHTLLAPYGDSVGVEVLAAPAAVRASRIREVQPDVFAYRRLGPRPDRYLDMRELLLAVEVLSPSTAQVDRHRKRVLYQSERVPEYWIVDVNARMIERWRPGDSEPEVLLTTLTWQPVPECDPLTMDVEAYFRAVHWEIGAPGT